MDSRRAAPLLGIAGCLATLVVLLAPYFVADASAVGIYYGAGALSPLIGGLFAAVSVIVFLAGRAGRTDPATAAGVVLVFGVVVAAVALVWALTVPEAVVFQLSTAALFEYHRWVLVVPSLVVPAGGLWYARALGLV